MDQLARKLYRNASRMIDTSRRKRVAFTFDARKSTEPTLYFLTPDHPTPAGGVRVIYRHVDILNANGIPARVLHWRRGFRCTWFQNDTKVSDLTGTVLGPRDLVVVPEIDVDLLLGLPEPVRYAIFNQNSFLTWRRLVRGMEHFYHPGPRNAGVITVSDHNAAMLSQAFFGCPVERVHLGIDAALFHPRSGERAQRIAYMPRRGRDCAEQVFGMLEGRGILQGWEVIALDGLAHEEVANQLRQTRIFLAFTAQEGFGLPAAEAMACGAYVIGNHGFGGREFFGPEWSCAVETGDVPGFTQAVKTAIKAERGDAGWCARRGLKASHFVLSEYSLAREVDEVVSLYASKVGAQ